MIDVGDMVRLSTSFMVDEALTDPEVVTLTVAPPEGAHSEHVHGDPLDTTVVRDSEGVYHADILATFPGTWVWRWSGSGGATGVEEGSFFVAQSMLDPDRGLLCTPQDVRDVLGDGLGGASDQLIRRLIAAASEAIMREARAEFAPPTEAVTRRFRLDGSTVLTLAPFSLREVTSITLDPEDSATELALPFYSLHPVTSRHGVYRWIEFTTRRRGIVEILGDWGYLTVPDDVRQACIAQVREWNVRDVSRFGEAFTDAEGAITIPQRSLSLHAWGVAQTYRDVVLV